MVVSLCKELQILFISCVKQAVFVGLIIANHGMFQLRSLIP